MSGRLRTKVDETLEFYANRGVFRAFSRVSAGRYRMQWHQDQFFDLVFDTAKHSLRFRVVLPKASREMYEDFKKFVAQRQSEETLEHRRIDPTKVRISCSHKNGNISLLFIAKDRDYEYATKRLIHLMHEVYLDFLQDYYEYTIETFDLDRDQL